MLAGSACSHSSASEFSLKGGALAYNGHVIDTSFKITTENFRTEGGVLASVVNNKANELKAIEIISEEGVLEIWLFNESSEKYLLKIDTYPTDYHVSWVSPQHLKVSRAHMGISVTYIYKISPPLVLEKKSSAIDKMIYFDPEKEDFSRYAFPGSELANDAVVVGRLFSDYKEVFEINLDYEYLSDALALIRNVTIENEVLFVSVKQGSGIVNYQYKLRSYPARN